MILVSSGVNMGLMAFGRDWKYIRGNWKEREEEIERREVKDAEQPAMTEKGHVRALEAMSASDTDVGVKINEKGQKEIYTKKEETEEGENPSKETAWGKQTRIGKSSLSDYPEEIILWDSHVSNFTSDELFLKGRKVVNGFKIGTYVERDADLSERLIFKKLNIPTTEEDGVEISCDIWIGSENVWEKSLSYSIEAKKFLSGDLGVETEGEYALVWFPFKKSTISRYTIQIAAWFRDNKYVGSLNVRYKVVGDTVYGAKITPRLGFVNSFGIFTLIDGYMGINGFMENLYENNFDVQPSEHNLYCFTLRVSSYPYPMKKSSGEATQKESPPSNIIFAKTGVDYGRVCGVSRKWNDAVRGVYQYASEGLEVPTKQYRDDGIEFLSDRMARLMERI